MRKLTVEIASELTGAGSVRRFGEDLRFGMRVSGRTPVLTAIVVLTLALGIGATTAVFSIVQAVLLRPLPYQDPERLVVIWDGHVREPGMAKVFASLRDFETWKRHGTSFERCSPSPARCSAR